MNDVRTGTSFDVGGVRLKQPFKIRRLGHFGFNCHNIERCVKFYRDVMGFRVSDPFDLSKVHPMGDRLKEAGNPHFYFLRHNTDHHTFVLLDRAVTDVMYGTWDVPDDINVNQITWQVGSLREVNRAIDWFHEIDVKQNRVGRDMPGSNWMVYPFDPEGHRNELYYGMEQIGWMGISKPVSMRTRDGMNEKPELPRVAEFEEVRRAIDAGDDLLSGFSDPETLPADYDVDGIWLPRPFKIERHGPVRLFVKDMDQMVAYYCGTLGFVVTEETDWKGHHCVFLRCNTEHHVLALYPIALRDELGLLADSTIMSLGIQVANFRQLRDAVVFMEEKGVEFLDVPPELSPGIDYGIYFKDPGGQAMQLYFDMEQVGWDGKPRPAAQRNPTNRADWPDTVESKSDTFMGETFMGPWG